MMSRLPRWVEYGAFTLALLAGMVNAVGLLGFQHQAVSHLSGTATLLGVGLLEPDNLHLMMILLSFLFGAMVSGFLISSDSLKLGRHYDSLLAIEAVFLCLAIYFLNRHNPAGHYLASAACGLQNALATKYSGAVVRTTHVTGIFTDLGMMLGAWLRGQGFDRRKCILFLLIIAGFLCGGLAGGSLFAYFRFYALLVPAGMCLVLAWVYRLYRRRASSG